MTSVHVVNRMAPGGIETLVLDLMRSGSPDERTVVISLEGKTEKLIQDWPALTPFRDDIVGLEAPEGRRFSLVPKLAMTLRGLKPAKVFAHHIGPLLYGGLATRAAFAGHLVHVEHDAWHYEENPSHQRILKFCERFLRPHHFAVSQPIARCLGELLPGAKVDVVAPGIDLSRFQPERRAQARADLGIAGDLPVIGTVGRLHPVKGQRFLIEAVSKLPTQCALVFVGGGSERDNLEALARELGVATQCHFLGHRDDVAALLPGFDVFALPSLGEGLPRAVLEAQAAGVPVVASDVGALRDAIAPGTGQLVPPKDAAALAIALEGMLSDGRPREAIANETRAFIAANFDFSKTRHRYAPTVSELSEAGFGRAQSV